VVRLLAEMTHVPEPRSDETGRHSRAPMFILGAVGAVLVLLVVACIVIVASLDSIGDNISLPGDKHFTPIPVAAIACPYLREVHDKADAASQTLWNVLGAQTAEWRTEAAQHAQQLAAFELTLRAAIPHVPAPVATELKTVRVKVAAGRKEIAAAHSATEYVHLSSGQVIDGTVALGNASDLVGNACGFKLSPDLSFAR
jgi:hypothetical protein